MVDEKKQYEIIEVRYRGGEKDRTRLDFKGTLEQAKDKATKLAKKNIGVRYVVFPPDGLIAEFQVYYRTTITCPRCGEIIPIE